MADSYLVNEEELSNGKDEEEDPILVAQRYLNIFHQIHIFNAAKKEEFDKTLLEMPEKIKELMITIPGGRVLLEHVKEIEEKQGISTNDTSSLISQNIEEEKKSIDSLKPHPMGGGGEITLSADFAENLANSLASALKNNNVASSGGNLDSLAAVLSKSFNAYASNMQTLTASILRQNAQQVTSQTTASTPLAAPNAATTTGVTTAQQNLQNNNSTTVNNINIDSSYFKSLNSTLQQNDARRHEDMMKIVSVLNQNIGNISSAAPGESGASSAILANTITTALRENNSQQIEAIKAFGEMLVQAFTQSQQELAKTLAKSKTRPTVKVVVSQDVDVDEEAEDETSASAPLAVAKPAAAPNNTPTKASKTTSVLPPVENKEKKEKGGLIKSFGEKLTETTNKLAQNLGNTQKEHSESLLNRINKSLNKINDLKKQNTNNNQPNKPEEKVSKPEKKEAEKNNKPLNNQPENKKIDNKPNAQPIVETSTKNKNSQPAAKTEQNPRIEPKQDKKAASFDKPKSETFAPKQSVDTLEKTPQNKTENKIPANQPVKPTTQQTENKAKNQADDASNNLLQTNDIKNLKDDFNLDSLLDDLPNEDISLPSTNSSDKLDIFADNNFGTPPSEKIFPAETAIETENKPSLTDKANILLNKENSETKPNNQAMPQTSNQKNEITEEETAVSADDLLANMAEDKPVSTPKTQLHSYEDALLKIKNALSSDEDVSLQNIDVKPVSLGSDDDFPSISNSSSNKANTQPAPQNDSLDEGDWEYVDENGNPISGDDDGEWEYVDENGNPISGDDDGEWEYVDENGNPISGDDDGEWEYVDENGNPIEHK